MLLVIESTKRFKAMIKSLKYGNKFWYNKYSFEQLLNQSGKW